MEASGTGSAVCLYDEVLFGCNVHLLSLSYVTSVWSRLCDWLQLAEPLRCSAVLFYWTQNTGQSVCVCVYVDVCVGVCVKFLTVLSFLILGSSVFTRGREVSNLP